MGKLSREIRELAVSISPGQLGTGTGRREANSAWGQSHKPAIRYFALRCSPNLPAQTHTLPQSVWMLIFDLLPIQEELLDLPSELEADLSSCVWHGGVLAVRAGDETAGLLSSLL